MTLNHRARWRTFLISCLRSRRAASIKTRRQEREAFKSHPCVDCHKSTFTLISRRCRWLFGWVAYGRGGLGQDTRVAGRLTCSKYFERQPANSRVPCKTNLQSLRPRPLPASVISLKWVLATKTQLTPFEWSRRQLKKTQKHEMKAK